MKAFDSDNTNDFLASFIIFQSTLLRPLVLYTGLNIYLMFFTSLIAIMIICIRKRNFKLKLIILLLALISYLVIEFLFRCNILSQYYIYIWIVNILIPVIAISGIKDYTAFLDWCYKFAIVSLAVYMLDPLKGYRLSNDYMSFGYDVMLPVFSISVIKSLYPSKSLKVRALNHFIMIISAVLMIFFANRGTILCIIFGILIKILFCIRKNKLSKNIIIISFTILISIVLYVNYFNIIEVMYNFCIKNNYYSYSLSSLYFSLKIDNGIYLGGRDEIISAAFNIFKDNILIGKGIGYFESIYGEGTYPHNLIADILSTCGIIGALVFLIANIFTIRTFAKADYSKKLVMLFFLFLFFPKLLLSSTFIKDTGFWIFIIFWVF